MRRSAKWTSADGPLRPGSTTRTSTSAAARGGTSHSAASPRSRNSRTSWLPRPTNSGPGGVDHRLRVVGRRGPGAAAAAPGRSRRRRPREPRHPDPGGRPQRGGVEPRAVARGRGPEHAAARRRGHRARTGRRTERRHPGTAGPRLPSRPRRDPGGAAGELRGGAPRPAAPRNHEHRARGRGALGVRGVGVGLRRVRRRTAPRRRADPLGGDRGDGGVRTAQRRGRRASAGGPAQGLPWTGASPDRRRTPRSRTGARRPTAAASYARRGSSAGSSAKPTRWAGSLRSTPSETRRSS